MHGRMKVLLISNLFPTPAEPTRGIFTLQLARRLGKTCDVTVVCPLPWFPRLGGLPLPARWKVFAGLPREYMVDGIRVHCPKYPMLPRLSEGFHAFLMFLGLFPEVLRLHRRFRFDAVNTQWLYPDGVAAGWIARLLKLPLVLTALGCDANLFLGQKEKRSQILASLRRATAVTAVSAGLKERLLREGFPAEKVAVIPNGVDMDVFQLKDRAACRGKLRISPRGRMILFVGQLLEVKGVRHLIDAAGRLAGAGEDFTLYLVGEGALGPAYRRMAEERGLSDRVLFAGARPHGEIAEWMGACDVFCLPSVREGWPNVVMEALASGRPVVASRVGGIPEVVGDGNGVLAEPEDGGSLAEALRRACARNWDPAEVRRSVEDLCWERAAELYAGVLRASAGMPEETAASDDRELARTVV